MSGRDASAAEDVAPAPPSAWRLRLLIGGPFEWFAFVYLALLIAGAVFAGVIPGLAAPNAPYGDFSGAPTLTVSGFLGTDALGRSIFSRVLYGARTSLTIACAATAISLSVGMFLGMLA